MTTNYHTAVAAGAAANASIVNAPLAQLDAAIGSLAAAVANIKFTSVMFSGTVTAAAFVGDGSGLTGVASGTGGVINTGSTTVGADSDGNGVGVIALQTGGVTRMQITADGDILLGQVRPTRVHAVYALGDSLTAAGTYPARLLANLGAGWAVRNAGVSGNTTTQMLARQAAECLTPGDGEYMVVLGGINDIVADASAATIEANLQALYSAAHTAGLKVIACTITPFKTNAYWTSGRQTVLDAVNAWILATAANVDYRVDGYELLESGSTDTLAAGYDSGDHLHLSTAGYEALADAVYAAATWTADTDVIALEVATTGTVHLSQSLRPTDDVAFHNIHVGGTLDMPVWKPAADGVAALIIGQADGSAVATVDTTNLSIGVNTAPDATAALNVRRLDTGAGSAYGVIARGLKLDATGSVIATALWAQAYNYAVSASSTVAAVNGIEAGIALHAESGKTATVNFGAGLSVYAPAFTGGGTHAVTGQYGIYIDNQGAAAVGTAYGLYIAGQTGASDNYALFTEAGKHRIGSNAAQIGFFGVTPVSRATLATGAGRTVDDVITALQNLGLVKQA